MVNGLMNKMILKMILFDVSVRLLFFVQQKQKGKKRWQDYITIMIFGICMPKV